MDIIVGAFSRWSFPSGYHYDSQATISTGYHSWRRPHIAGMTVVIRARSRIRSLVNVSVRQVTDALAVIEYPHGAQLPSETCLIPLQRISMVISFRIKGAVTVAVRPRHHVWGEVGTVLCVGECGKSRRRGRRGDKRNRKKPCVCILPFNRPGLTPRTTTLLDTSRQRADMCSGATKYGSTLSVTVWYSIRIV